jgi:hypothetical protein
MTRKADHKEVNELADIEETLLGEMREEYRKRIRQRLQKLADTHDSVGPDGLLLKKKDGSASA